MIVGRIPQRFTAILRRSYESIMASQMSIPAPNRPRIAVVQFNPKYCAVVENIETARRICAQLAPHSVDLVCLSELAFTGYVFPDAATIKPFLEEPQTGPTSRFCAELAKRLHCHVIAGYPERLQTAELESGIDSEGNAVAKIGANSAILYGPVGTYVGNYRKTNLFDVDTTWAKAGTGFKTFRLPEPLNTVSVGICMDLNVQAPDTWNSLENGPYEIANYTLSQKADILVLLNAWLRSPDDEGEDCAWSTINYWAQRLRPLWAPDVPSPAESTSSTHVVVCNRFGEENGKTFCGSSTLFRMNRGSGKPKVVRAMEKEEEGVQVWTL